MRSDFTWLWDILRAKSETRHQTTQRKSVMAAGSDITLDITLLNRWFGLSVSRGGRGGEKEGWRKGEGGREKGLG